MKDAPKNLKMVMTACIQVSLMNNLEVKTQIKVYYDFFLIFSSSKKPEY